MIYDNYTFSGTDAGIGSVWVSPGDWRWSWIFSTGVYRLAFGVVGAHLTKFIYVYLREAQDK